MEIPNHIEHIPTCRYQIPTVQVQNTCTYLLLYVSLSSCIFARNTCAGFCAGFCVGFCAGFCAVASPSAWSHRRRIAASHRVADFIRITSASGALALRQPTCCTRTEEVEPHQRALDESMMRTHVEVMVERL